MNTFMVTIESGEHRGRSFIIEDVRNEADAINEAFKRAAYSDAPDDYIRVSCTMIPINRKFPTREDLIRILLRYESAVGEVERGGDEDQIPELEQARKELMDLLEQAKVNIPV